MVRISNYADFGSGFDDDRRVAGKIAAGQVTDIDRTVIGVGHLARERVFSFLNQGRIHRHGLRRIRDQVGDVEAGYLINFRPFQGRVFHDAFNRVTVPAAGGNKQGGPQGRRCE